MCHFSSDSVWKTALRGKSEYQLNVAKNTFPDSSFEVWRVHDVRHRQEDRLHVPLLQQDRRAEVVLPEDRAELGSPRQGLVIWLFCDLPERVTNVVNYFGNTFLVHWSELALTPSKFGVILHNITFYLGATTGSFVIVENRGSSATCGRLVNKEQS